jgi:streptogramin lyase
MDHDQLAARLRLALEREAARHQVSPGAWPQIERRRRRRTRRQITTAAACLAAVAAAATAAPYLWQTVSGPAVGHSHPRPAAQLAVVGRTHLSRGITKLAAGYGGVWVVGYGVIYRVDAATGKTVATIPARGTDKLSDIAAGGGAVWATSAAPSFGVYRIDPRHNRVTSFIHLPPTPTEITVAYGQVWVAEPQQGGVVVRINPGTNRPSGPPIRVCCTDPGSIVAGFGALWVTSAGVSRINPATGTVTRTLVNIPDVTAAGAGSLWGTGTYGGIQRVDPATGQVTATIRLPGAVNVVYWAGSAWAADDQAGTLTRIDPRSNRTTGAAAPAGTSPIYLTASPNGLWVADIATGDLLHLAVPPAAK